jgi:hypothetical protein
MMVVVKYHRWPLPVPRGQAQPLVVENGLLLELIEGSIGVAGGGRVSATSSEVIELSSASKKPSFIKGSIAKAPLAGTA